jgi:hypothetical protein
MTTTVDHYEGCDGNGFVTCEDCAGTGVMVVDYDESNGVELTGECGTCDGVGTHECPSCADAAAQKAVPI